MVNENEGLAPVIISVGLRIVELWASHRCVAVALSTEDQRQLIGECSSDCTIYFPLILFSSLFGLVAASEDRVALR